MDEIIINLIKIIFKKLNFFLIDLSYNMRIVVVGLLLILLFIISSSIIIYYH